MKKKVYISSTYKDLIEHRQAVATALRRIGCEVVCMEEYVARDERTRAACEADVSQCDIYVGIFAWRYGHIPEDDNEARLSITELEYRAASGKKTCLVFLVSDEAPWPSILRDAETGEGEQGARIRALRAELKGRCAGYFSTPAELALEVIAAVHQDEATRRVHRLDVLDQVRESVNLGPSFLINILNKITEAGDAEIVEINLGPTPWWTTRLHLVAALAGDFTNIRQLAFLDDEGRYVLMASPSEVRRALGRRRPQFERVYLESRPAEPLGAAQEINRIVAAYPIKLSAAFDRKREEDVMEVVTSIMLRRDLGIEPSAEAVERSDGPRAAQQREILRRATPFVVLLDGGRLVSVIDRVRMATELAVRALEE